MGGVFIVDDPVLALVLRGTHFPTSKEWQVELA